jgi:hypothetical protein
MMRLRMNLSEYTRYSVETLARGHDNDFYHSRPVVAECDGISLVAFLQPMFGAVTVPVLSSHWSEP